MPGMRCAVAVCDNDVQNTRTAGKNVSFFRFPKEDHLRKMWIHRCRRDDEWNWKTSRICSEHFREKDFERDMQSELLNIPGKRKLKSEAVPSVKLTKMIDVTTQPQQRELKITAQRRTEKSLVKQLFSTPDDQNLDQEAQTEMQSMTEETASTSTSMVTVEETEYNKLIEKVTSLTKENDELKKEVQDQKQALEEYKHKYNCINRNIKQIAGKEPKKRKAVDKLDRVGKKLRRVIT